jgi:hypothetical protein
MNWRGLKGAMLPLVTSIRNSHPVITSGSCAVLEFPRIEPPLGLNQGNQQPFISTTFGSPSEVRYLPSGPQHAQMPRARRGRFEPLDHFVPGQLSMLGLFSAVVHSRVHRSSCRRFAKDRDPRIYTVFA